MLKKMENHALIFYDGECGLCQFWVQFILRRDRKKYFKFTSLQSPYAKNILKDFDEKNMDTVLLVKDNTIHKRSNAVLTILGHLFFPWNVLKIFIILPESMRDFFYDLLAKNRHLIFRKKSCLLPTKEERDRFI